MPFVAHVEYRVPLEKAEEIQRPYSWGGGQPWWGLTDLKRAMTERLDSFRNPDGRPGSQDRTAYALPIRIHYEFFDEGGYVRLAKEYRKHFLGLHPEMRPLRERIAERPAVAIP